MVLLSFESFDIPCLRGHGQSEKGKELKGKVKGMILTGLPTQR